MKDLEKKLFQLSDLQLTFPEKQTQLIRTLDGISFRVAQKRKHPQREGLIDLHPRSTKHLKCSNVLMEDNLYQNRAEEFPCIFLSLFNF